MADDILLTFNTIVTKITQRHRQMWPQFKPVKPPCSTGACGPLNDYIRHPTNYQQNSMLPAGLPWHFTPTP